MSSRRLPFVAIVLAALAVAGCAGAPSRFGSPGASTGGLPVAPLAPAGMRRLRPSRHQRYRLILPLVYTDQTFFVAGFTTCGDVGPGSAPPYTQPATAPLALAGNIVVVPACAPPAAVAGRPVSPLYVIAIRRGGHHRPARVGRSGSRPTLGVALAGPALVTTDPWSFAPFVPSPALRGGRTYAFFVAESDAPALRE